LTLPTLIVRGVCDIQVSEADFDALVRARPDALRLVLPLTNHVFKPAPADISDRVAQIKSYNPAAPLVPGLVPAVVDFVSAAARRAAVGRRVAVLRRADCAESGVAALAVERHEGRDRKERGRRRGRGDRKLAIDR